MKVSRDSHFGRPFRVLLQLAKHNFRRSFHFQECISKCCPQSGKDFFSRGCNDFIQASVETNVKAKGRAKQTEEQSKRAIPGETK
jgi:hypothetical protein